MYNAQCTPVKNLKHSWAWTSENTPLHLFKRLVLLRTMQSQLNPQQQASASAQHTPHTTHSDTVTKINDQPAGCTYSIASVISGITIAPQLARAFIRHKCTQARERERER
eukprot:scpid111294/ scgid23209/ 